MGANEFTQTARDGDVTRPSAPMTRLARPDRNLPVLSRDGAWAYTWEADRQTDSRAVATRVATGEPTYFVDFDTARRWTYQQANKSSRCEFCGGSDIHTLGCWSQRDQSARCDRHPAFEPDNCPGCGTQAKI